MIKSWLSYCETRHKRICSPSSAETANKLRVIDVDTLEVKAAPKNCEYVALSYVWGEPSSAGRYSKVVEDSFVVTRNLGYKYLWVDKHASPAPPLTVSSAY